MTTLANGLTLLAMRDDDVFAFLVVFIAIGAFVAVVSVIAFNWRRTKEAGYNARLKQLMIERGMSGEEIERVIVADPSTEAGRREWAGITNLIHGRRAG
jgi:hypothetical protein